MVKISIRVRYPDIRLIEPFRLIDQLSSSVKEEKLVKINSIFSQIKRWTDVERNYTT